MWFSLEYSFSLDSFSKNYIWLPHKQSYKNVDFPVWHDALHSLLACWLPAFLHWRISPMTMESWFGSSLGPRHLRRCLTNGWDLIHAFVFIFILQKWSVLPRVTTSFNDKSFNAIHNYLLNTSHTTSVEVPWHINTSRNNKMDKAPALKGLPVNCGERTEMSLRPYSCVKQRWDPATLTQLHTLEHTCF